jgi:3-dehydroquinate dehydratase-2
MKNIFRRFLFRHSLLGMVTILISLHGISTAMAQANPAASDAPSLATKRLRILVVNGPNINLLGRRQPEIYGHMTLDEINRRMKELGDRLNVELIFMQSNSEGAIVDAFQAHFDDVDGAIMNSAGYSQHSIAIHDVVEAVPFPTIEVHISNIAARDEWHRADVIMPVVKSAVVGFGWRGYLLALQGLTENLRDGMKK